MGKSNEVRQPPPDQPTNQNPDLRISQTRIDEAKSPATQFNISSHKKVDTARKNSPHNVQPKNSARRESPPRSNPKIDIGKAIPTSSNESKSERNQQFSSSHKFNAKPNHSHFKFNHREYEPSHNPTNGTDMDDEETKEEQLEYEKMRKEVDQFLKKKNTIDASQSAGTANELKAVLRQLEITRKKARGITDDADEEDDNQSIHRGANIDEITDGALGAFAMAQKKTAKKVIRHIAVEQKVEEAIQAKPKTETGVNVIP